MAKKTTKKARPQLRATPADAEFNESGSKYLRPVVGLVDGKVDVYAILETFDVRCPARQHAIKKLLCTGIRGKGDALQDLREANDAVTRAIQLEMKRNKQRKPSEWRSVIVKP